MHDRQIIDLYFARDERAVLLTKEKYGAMCFSIAQNILGNCEDAAECENDAYFSLWNAIPPVDPQKLGAFLAKITRNIAIKKLREQTAKKRGAGYAVIPLDELIDCLKDNNDIENQFAAKELADLLNCFLETLERDERNVFICRYWYCDSIADISSYMGFTKSKIKMILLRTREKLSVYLKKEGVIQ